MRTNLSQKLLKIVDEIDRCGNVNMTKLTVLKKWFEHPGRLAAFGIWMAGKAVSLEGKKRGKVAKLVNEARSLLADSDPVRPQIDRQKATILYRDLREFQNEFRNHEWGAVRVIHNLNLLLIEEGLDLYLRHFDSPPRGYKLAVDYCHNYDMRYGNGLNGPSRGRVKEIASFVDFLEAAEEILK